MKADEIKAVIVGNMNKAKLAVKEIRVQPDPYSGWRIGVLSTDFGPLTHEQRRAIVLAGLKDVELAWVDLLTPGEREWAGALPIDSDLNDLPLWPEAFARSHQRVVPAVFPSDLDEDLPLPIVVTFYSLRGGVGRSTALGYTARILSSRGRKVVCVDMDLEAPGLAALFGKEREVQDETGVANLLVQLDRGESPDISKHLIRVVEGEDLYCLPAGRPDASYARLLRLIDPSAWYREDKNPLRKLIERVEQGLPFKPDVVLLDARTGITPLSGPLLFDIGDIAVVVFFPHPQARTGTAALVRALLAAKTRRVRDTNHFTPEPRFLVSPIPSSKAREVVEKFQHRALEWIAEWLSPASEQSAVGSSLVEAELTHFIPYRESLATADEILSDTETWRDFEPVAEWVERFLPSASEERSPLHIGAAKSQVLQEIRFSTGTAEEQEDFLATFVETEVVKNALDSRIPLVLGRKGAGKTAVFRRLLEDKGRSSVVVLAPAPLRPHKWLLGVEGFGAAEELLQKRSADWRQFWSFYTCFAIRQSLAPTMRAQTDGELAKVLQESRDSETGVIRLLESVTKLPQFGLLLNDWLTRLDAVSQSDTLLLYDGLDTGFGSGQNDRTRRGEAIEGLFGLWMDRGQALRNLRFKIVLREDIWRKVRFENKSHLFGRSVTLQWKTQATFFKVVVKQALRSAAFGALLDSNAGTGRLRDTDPGIWTDGEVYGAWNLLVGDRMKGGKTAFTRNWVWSRLADGNEDHSPRHLLQLFGAVADWERQEHKKTPYDRSVVRPRALAASLPVVSGQALDALQEEFPELEPLLAVLRQIGHTPVPATDLDKLAEMVGLAREVGLLAVYEGTDEKVERYKVPEIYRHALGMTRRGQL